MLIVKSEYRKIAKYIIYMKVAEMFSLLSCDRKHQVGAILVKKDFKNVISIGYNGPRPGAPNVRKSMEYGQSGFFHAEHNCLMRANIPGNPKEYMLFCVKSPCEACAGDLAMKEIDTVYYKEPYVTGYKAGYEAMISSGIKVESIWNKLEGMFKDIVHFETLEYLDINSVLSEEGVRILTKKHLDEFEVPFDNSINYDDWRYDYAKHFIRYLYRMTKVDDINIC